MAKGLAAAWRQIRDFRMSVVSAHLYRHGIRVRDIALDERVSNSDDRSELCWISIESPTRDELATLQTVYCLHPLAVENALRPSCPPKLDTYDDQLFAVAQTAELIDGKIRYGKVAIFLGRSHLISVRHGNAGALADIREQLEVAPAQLSKGVGYILHAILHGVVDDYLPIIEMLEEDVLAMERRSADDFLGRSEITRIFALRRELTRFQRTLGAMTELVRKLARRPFDCIDDDVRPYFGDVADHVGRVRAMAGGLLQALTSVFEFSSLLEQQRTGATTRQLAAWAAILAVPTAIAGIYGMNFRFMPELNLRYGYFVVLTAMTGLCLLLFVRFRKAGWI